MDLPESQGHVCESCTFNKPPKEETPSPDDIEGKTPQEIEDMIGDWPNRPAKTGDGTVYENPDWPGDHVRVFPEVSPQVNTPVHQGPYATVSKSGESTRVPLF